MNIPLVDLTGLSKAVEASAKKVITSTDFILGKEVEIFEKKFAEYIGTKYCVGLASGTDALFLSLKALGIGKGDEVIMPAMTFMATAASVIHAGATPVFVDILATEPLIDPEQIKKKISKKTKAIIPVHLHGYPCNMNLINKIAKEHKLFVIEDACQAHGSVYKGKRPGSLSDIAAFSFYPSKNLGGFGDGGAITTSNEQLAKKMLLLRNQGTTGKYRHELVGYNSRLDSLHAAVLTKKLTTLDKDNAKRRKHALLYTKLLKGLPLQVPDVTKNEETNYHIYAIQVKERDALLLHLKKKHVYGGVHYPIPLHLQPALVYLKYKKGDFPHSELFAERTLSLPMYPSLTSEQISFVCKEIGHFFSQNETVKK